MTNKSPFSKMFPWLIFFILFLVSANLWGSSIFYKTSQNTRACYKEKNFVFSKEYESTGLTPQEVYDRLIKDKVNSWDMHASLILVWGLEYGKDNYLFPDWGYMPPPNALEDKSRIVRDSHVGDGRANIWLFVFYSKSKGSLYEIRAYLNPYFGWLTSERDIPTPFDYSAWEIDLKSLKYAGTQGNSVIHLLWRYNNLYGWINYANITHKGYGINLNKALHGERFDSVYFWESSIPFIENLNDLYPFTAESVGILILPDYGEIGDFNSPTYLLWKKDELTLIYPTCEMHAKYHINPKPSLNATAFNTQLLEEHLKNTGFLKIKNITYGIFTYSFYSENGNDTLDISHRVGTNAIEHTRIELGQYEILEKHSTQSNQWIYYALVSGIIAIAAVAAIYYFHKRR